jgi:ComF family protein
MLKPALDSLLTVLYPQACHCCGESVERYADGVACADCWAKTRLFSGTEDLCGKCGAFRAGSGRFPNSICGQCRDHHYDRAAAAGIYEHALAASILELKRNPFIPKRLRFEFALAFERAGFDPIDVAVPAPLSRARLLERGFNQAEFVTGILAKSCGIQVDAHNLSRKTHSAKHRAGMDRKARELTVRNAFEVRHPKLIQGKTILLVDDVFTSGATASYCAKALKKSGARKVFVFTLARAV